MTPLYHLSQLPFWDAEDLSLRDMFVHRITTIVKKTLLDINPAWRFERCEGPLLTPSKFISSEYTEKDLFVTNHEVGGEFLKLRAETTASSYEVARYLMNSSKTKLPLCVYQLGKSFRRELSDGATGAKLRFNEFYQLEFQCIYSEGTKADYRTVVMDSVAKQIQLFTNGNVFVIDSDRIPSYSESTKDIMINDFDKGRELASCSIRNDFAPNTKVFELAIGVDRVVHFMKNA